MSVGYETADGTATKGVDYEAAQGTVSWADGDMTPKTFRIALKRNPAMPCGARFAIRFTSVSGHPTIFQPRSSVVIDYAARSRITRYCNAIPIGTARHATI